MNPSQLEQVFACGTLANDPVGAWKGRVLVRTDGKLGRVRARLASVVWKGKCFDEDGGFINQWLGFRAVGSQATIAPSWYDGKPCLVLEYPPDAAMFSNTRDELREIAPGVYLGRFYERCPCPRLQGYFLLEKLSCVHAH